jgi:subfamily B ATP-binding cassette protein MsbA
MAKTKISIAKVFRTIVWPRRYILLLGLVLIVISRLAGLVIPYGSKILIDEIVPNADLEKLKLFLIAITGALIIQSGTSFALTMILSVEAQHLIAKLRARVQQQIIKLPIRFFDNQKSGALVSRIMTDVEGV